MPLGDAGQHGQERLGAGTYPATHLSSWHAITTMHLRLTALHTRLHIVPAFLCLHTPRTTAPGAPWRAPPLWLVYHALPYSGAALPTRHLLTLLSDRFRCRAPAPTLHALNAHKRAASCHLYAFTATSRWDGYTVYLPTTLPAATLPHTRRATHLPRATFVVPLFAVYACLP